MNVKYSVGPLPIAPPPRGGPVTSDQVPSVRSHSGAGSAHTGFCGEGFFSFLVALVWLQVIKQLLSVGNSFGFLF